MPPDVIVLSKTWRTEKQHQLHKQSNTNRSGICLLFIFSKFTSVQYFVTPILYYYYINKKQKIHNTRLNPVRFKPIINKNSKCCVVYSWLLHKNNRSLFIFQSIKIILGSWLRFQSSNHQSQYRWMMSVSKRQNMVHFFWWNVVAAIGGRYYSSRGNKNTTTATNSIHMTDNYLQ